MNNNFLIDLFFEITFEKVEKSNNEEPIFKDGTKISTPCLQYCKG